ncbi:MAG: acyltransferase [Verrucomicrobia bacterium]|nr:MAG: acyltransferase [Verrucomicrobiota bacterium]
MVTSKYEFPAHLFVLWDMMMRYVAVTWWTLWTRMKLFALRCPVGRGLQVDGPLVIQMAQRGSVVLADHVTINSRFGSNLVGLTGASILHCIREGRIEIGPHSGGSSVVLSARTLIRIGAYVKIGGNVRIYDHDFHSQDHLARRTYRADQLAVKAAPVIIDDDVFIGANAIVLKGVHIGARSVIGAGAVVALKDIPPDSVVVGNPARIINISVRNRA